MSKLPGFPVGEIVLIRPDAHTPWRQGIVLERHLTERGNGWDCWHLVALFNPPREEDRYWSQPVNDFRNLKAA